MMTAPEEVFKALERWGVHPIDQVASPPMQHMPWDELQAGASLPPATPEEIAKFKDNEENMWWLVWQATKTLHDLAEKVTAAGYPSTAARATDQALFWEEFANQGLPF